VLVNVTQYYNEVHWCRQLCDIEARALSTCSNNVFQLPPESHKVYNGRLSLSGSLFHTAFKTFEVGNEKCSMTL